MRTLPRLAALMLVLLSAAPAFADTKSEVLGRMKERFKTLSEARDAGEVGEAWAGNCAAVPADVSKKTLTDARKKEVEDLVKAENDDRAKLYAILAKEENTTPEKVAERNRERLFKKADDGHFLRDADKKWMTKKDWAAKK